MNKYLHYKLLNKTLKSGVPAGTLIVLAVGLTLLLAAAQTWVDINSLGQSGNAYVSVQKKSGILSSGLSLLGMDNSGFTADQLQQLNSLPGVEASAPIIAAAFPVEAEFNGGRFNYRTELFFESISDDFLDVHPQNWGWQPGSLLPVVVPYDYLNLYNLGFAPARGMPQITPEIASKFHLDVLLPGGHTVTAYLAGFSHRINTILVPNAFIQWGNQRFADNSPLPRRVIVKVNPRQHQNFLQQLGVLGCESATDTGLLDNLGQVLNWLALGLGLVGVITAVTSLGAVRLTVLLAHCQAQEPLNALSARGWLPAELAKPFIKGLWRGVLFSWVAAMFIVTVARLMLLPALGATTLPLYPSPVMILALSACLAAYLAWVYLRLLKSIAQ